MASKPDYIEALIKYGAEDPTQHAVKANRNRGWQHRRFHADDDHGDYAATSQGNPPLALTLGLVLILLNIMLNGVVFAIAEGKGSR